MRTSKTISTISYNTKEFLKEKLNELIDNRVISNWFFIEHEPEEDERKKHIHLWVKPNKLLDTVDFQKFFLQLVPGEEKPRKCIDFVTSKADDAILYFLHDAKYLAMKGESRKYHYLRKDMVVYDDDDFEFLYNHAYRGSDFALKNQQLQAVIDNRDDMSKLIDCGLIPLSMAGNLCAYSNLRMNENINKTHRNGRKNHE